MIPYYAKDAGIKAHTVDNGGNFYVVLDKATVDKMPHDRWETFESVRLQCQKELQIALDFGLSFIALSPDQDMTYVINFVSLSKPSNGELLS